MRMDPSHLGETSLKPGWNLTSTRLRYHFNQVEISLQPGWDLTLTMVRSHFNQDEISLQPGWDLNSTRVRFHFNLGELSLQTRWDFTSTRVRSVFTQDEVSLQPGDFPLYIRLLLGCPTYTRLILVQPRCACIIVSWKKFNSSYKINQCDVYQWFKIEAKTRN